MSRDLLAFGDLENIAGKYGSLPAAGILLWVDELDESSVGKQLLKRFTELIRGLKNRGKQVYNLYGGYFSVLLGRADGGMLDGVCHGPEYGESRSVVPVGGGFPVARFYYPEVHTRVRYADAARILGRQGYFGDTPARYGPSACKITYSRHRIYSCS